MENKFSLELEMYLATRKVLVKQLSALVLDTQYDITNKDDISLDLFGGTQTVSLRIYVGGFHIGSELKISWDFYCVKYESTSSEKFRKKDLDLLELAINLIREKKYAHYKSVADLEKLLEEKEIK